MYMLTATTYMHRTTILLPEDLRAKAETAARQRGITLSELIRRLLAGAVHGKNSSRRDADPLFRPRRLMVHPNPPDIAANHDEYLYPDTFQGTKPVKK
jgi:hypothetical protein